MIYRILDLEDFKSSVFGADSFLEHFPQLIKSGVELLKQGDVHYITDAVGNIVSDSAFFTQEDMEYLELVKQEKPGEE